MRFKRVAIAIIAILVAIGLTGCTPEYRVPYEDLELRCERMEEAPGDIYCLVDDAMIEVDDVWEGSTYAWAILSGQEMYDEDEARIAARDIEDSWDDVDELVGLLNDIQSIADDARYD